MRTAPITGWLRRTLVLATIVLTLVLSTLLWSPSHAAAAGVTYCPSTGCLITPSVSQRYTGWAYLPDTNPICEMACPHRDGAAAYSWTGSAWSATTVTFNQWVYVTPYAPGWRWAYTSRTGWTAMSSDETLRLNY